MYILYYNIQTKLLNAQKKCYYHNWNLSFIHYFFILSFMGHLYIAWQFPPSNKFTGKNNYMIYIHYYRHDELIKERFLFATAKCVFFTFPQKIPCPPFFYEYPQRKTLSDRIISLFFVCSVYLLFILCTTVSYNIWSWCFPVNLIYDPDSSPSLSYIWSWIFPVMHCLIYDSDSSPSVPYCTRNSEVYVFVKFV